MDVKRKEFKRDNRDFHLVQNLTMGEADFNQFMRLRNQLVIPGENFGIEGNLSPVLTPTMSKDTDEESKLAHKLVDLVDRAKTDLWLFCGTMWKPESSYARVPLFARKKEDEKFQQVVYENYKLEEFIYLLDVMNTVYDKVITNQPICNVVWKKVISSIYSLSFLF